MFCVYNKKNIIWVGFIKLFRDEFKIRHLFIVRKWHILNVINTIYFDTAYTSIAIWKMILYKRKYIMYTKAVNGWTLTSFCVPRNTNQPFDTLLKYKNNNTQFHFENFSHLIFHVGREKNVSRLFTHGKEWETCGDWHIRRQKT